MLYSVRLWEEGRRLMRKLKPLLYKELLDILRDKKTLIIMVLVPMLLYPAIFMGTAMISSGMILSQKEKTYQVAYPKEAQESVKELIEFYHKNR